MRRSDQERALRDVGRRVAELRQTIGLTQAELAEAVGVGAKYMQQIEAGGQNLTLRSLFSLASALRVSPAELLEPPRNRAPRRPGRPRRA